MKSQPNLADAKRDLRDLWSMQAQYFDDLATGLQYFMLSPKSDELLLDFHAYFQTLSGHVNGYIKNLDHAQIDSWEQYNQWMEKFNSYVESRMAPVRSVISGIQRKIDISQDSDLAELSEEMEQRQQQQFKAFHTVLGHGTAMLNERQCQANKKLSKDLSVTFKDAGEGMLEILRIERTMSAADPVSMPKHEAELKRTRRLNQKLLNMAEMLGESVAPQQDMFLRTMLGNTITNGEKLLKVRNDFEKKIIENPQPKHVYAHANEYIHTIDRYLINLKKAQFQMKESLRDQSLRDQSRGR